MLGRAVDRLRLMWLPIAVGLLVTLAAEGLVLTAKGVYWGKTQLVVTLSYPNATSNVLATRDQSVVMFAAAVARRVSGSPNPYKLSSPDAPIYASGTRSQTQVRLLDMGAQWNTDFRRPFIVIETVAPDATTAEEQLESAKSAIVKAAESLQGEIGVPENQRLQIVPAVPDPGVTYIRAGSRARGSLTALLLGFGAAVAALWLERRWEQRGRRRRGRRRRTGPRHT